MIKFERIEPVESPTRRYQTLRPVTSKNIGKNHVKTGKLYPAKGTLPKRARRPESE